MQLNCVNQPRVLCQPTPKTECQPTPKKKNDRKACYLSRGSSFFIFNWTKHLLIQINSFQSHWFSTCSLWCWNEVEIVNIKMYLFGPKGYSKVFDANEIQSIHKPISSISSYARTYILMLVIQYTYKTLLLKKICANTTQLCLNWGQLCNLWHVDGQTWSSLWVKF